MLRIYLHIAFLARRILINGIARARYGERCKISDARVYDRSRLNFAIDEHFSASNVKKNTPADGISRFPSAKMSIPHENEDIIRVRSSLAIFIIPFHSRGGIRRAMRLASTRAPDMETRAVKTSSAITCCEMISRINRPPLRFVPLLPVSAFFLLTFLLVTLVLFAHFISRRIREIPSATRGFFPIT